MKEKTTKQEIILFTGTTFSGRQCNAKQSYRNHRKVSEAAQLEEICRNGQLQAMLPEICETTFAGDELVIRNIRKRTSFVEIELGDEYVKSYESHSLDPEIFITLVTLN